MKLIHQIWITSYNQAPPDYILKKIDNLKSIYSDYEYRMYNDTDIQKILEENFDKNILNAYLTLIPYAFKSDLARLCILYLYGGFYWDTAISPDEKWEFDDSVLVLGDKSVLGSGGMPIIENNCMFFKTAKHPLLKIIIDKIVDNIYRLDRGEHALDVTGPIAIGRIIENTNYDIKYAKVEYIDDIKCVTIDDKLFYKFKPKEFTSKLHLIGAEGTNDYSELWHSGDVFHYKLSHIVITNGKREDVTRTCLKSILNNLSSNDELILVGDVDKFKDFSNRILFVDAKETAHMGNLSGLRNKGLEVSTGNIIINSDSDILFPEGFNSKLIHYLKKTKHDVFNTIMYLPDGGRWWDKMAYRGNGNTFLVDYDYNLSDLCYVGSFLIRKRFLAENVLFNEDPIFYYDSKHPIHTEDLFLKSLDSYEDIEYTKQLREVGYNSINIDMNNYIFHYDSNYISIIREDGTKGVIKKQHFQNGFKPERNKEVERKFRLELVKLK